jgi:SHS2 domain-containing protein
MPFELTDIHTTADVGIRASGATLSELFRDTALGLLSVIGEPGEFKEERSLDINLTADSLEELYYDWLSEIVFYKDAQRFLPGRIQIIDLNEKDFAIKAVLYGETIDPSRHTLKVDVKAITHYCFKIEKDGLFWRGEVVLDI